MRLEGSLGDLSYQVFGAPIGQIGLVGGDEGLVEVVIKPSRAEVQAAISKRFPGVREQACPCLVAARAQLEEYFSGRRTRFEVKLDQRGLSAFQRRVLAFLQDLPFGDVTTYGELARLAGSPRAARAVGSVMAINPFAILVPCHRVLAGDGRLGGYSGGEGPATKAWLLDFEKSRRLQTEKIPQKR